MSECGFPQPTCFEPSLFESNQLQSFTPNASVCQTAEKETDLGAGAPHLLLRGWGPPGAASPPPGKDPSREQR